MPKALRRLPPKTVSAKAPAPLSAFPVQTPPARQSRDRTARKSLTVHIHPRLFLIRAACRRHGGHIMNHQNSNRYPSGQRRTDRNPNGMHAARQRTPGTAYQQRRPAPAGGAPRSPYQPNRSGGSRRRRRRTSPAAVTLTVLCSALGLVLLTVIIILACGYRYQKRQLSDNSTVKYFGKVDSSGSPKSGKLFYEDGTTAKVDMQKGTVSYSNGNVYEGKLTELMRSGKGTMRYPNGDVYEGDFIGDKLTGSGKFTFANGDSYEGELADGKKNGKGTYTWANGDVYVGDFVTSVRTGEGTYTWANGDSYTGHFENNMMNGQGTYTWAGGRTYTGTFENGKIVRTSSAE